MELRRLIADHVDKVTEVVEARNEATKHLTEKAAKERILMLEEETLAYTKRMDPIYQEIKAVRASFDDQLVTMEKAFDGEFTGAGWN